MILIYLKGLGVIIGAIVWIVIFNYGWWKLTKEKLWEGEILVVILMPWIILTGILVIFSLPLIIGEIMF